VRQLVLKKAMHRELMGLEKDAYYKARIKGRVSKMIAGVKVRRHMSIIIDGMDQGKSAVPSPARMDKKLDPCTTLTTHIVGALDHGGATPAQLYVSDPSIPHDVNGVITILCRVIKRAADDPGPLPPTLYVQLDGAGENKCKMLLLFLAILVALGVFVKIKLSFLPVGHTHEVPLPPSHALPLLPPPSHYPPLPPSHRTSTSCSADCQSSYKTVTS